MDTGVIESTAGVELDKHYERDEYELPSVVYEFVSNRSDTVEITLEETIPAELNPEFLGFHANYGSEHWEVQDDTMVFEYELDPDEEYKTVIGVNPKTEFDVETSVTAPETFEIDVLEGATGSHSSQESFTRSASSDDDSSSAEVTPSPIADGQNDRSRSHSDQETANSQTTAKEPSEAAASEEHDGGLVAGDSIGQRLAAEIEAGTISDQALETLGQELSSEHAVFGSQKARIDQLEQDFSKLRAYTTALEEFLDENGSAGGIIQEFEDDMESFEDELQAVTTHVDAHDDDIDSLRADMDEREEEQNSLSTSVASIQDDINELSSEMSAITAELPEEDVDERLATLEGEVAEVSEIINRLNEAFK